MYMTPRRNLQLYRSISSGVVDLNVFELAPLAYLANSFTNGREVRIWQ